MNSATIKDRIERLGYVNWKKCSWLQPKNLKKQSETQAQKLRDSLLGEGVASPLLVWVSKKDKKIYILDAHQRHKALIELEESGAKVPIELPAAFIKCDNKKDAKKLLLIYNSHYAEIQEDVLQEWMSDIKLDNLNIDIPGIDIDSLFKDSSTKETMNLSLIEKYMVPPFSVLDTRQGYWQDRKRAWIALGIKSELGRGQNLMGYSGRVSLKRAGTGAIPSNQVTILKKRGEYRK